MRRIRVLTAVHDVRRWRNVLVSLRRDKDLSLRQCPWPGPETVEHAVRAYKPEVVLIENYGKVFEITKMIRLCRLMFPYVRVILIGEKRDREGMLMALSAGAKGYLTIASSPGEFIKAIREVFQGSLWMPRSVISEFHDRVTSAQTLSARELQVLDLVRKKYVSKQIADRLGISERTVKFHVANLKRKLHVKRKKEL